MLRHDDVTPFPEWIRDLRKRTGLNQTDFGQLVGVHRTTVGRWETGVSPFRGIHRILLNDLALALGKAPIAPIRRPRRGRVIHLPEEYTIHGSR